jgi:F0F1-type ATP synthase assembly protein I
MRNRLARLYSIGTDFGLTVIIVGAMGFGVDYLAKTKPWGLLIGIVAGVLLGGYRFIRAGLAANRKALEDLKKNRGR